MLHVQITTQTIVHDVGGTLDRGELEAAATVKLSMIDDKR